MKLKVPNIIIIGEGGSGGAIALASSNKVIMLENAIYSVISPEGCNYSMEDPENINQLRQWIIIKDLLELNVIDEIIQEPLGGANRDKNLILNNVRQSILKFENFNLMSLWDF